MWPTDIESTLKAFDGISFTLWQNKDFIVEHIPSDKAVALLFVCSSIWQVTTDQMYGRSLQTRCMTGHYIPDV